MTRSYLLLCFLLWEASFRTFGCAYLRYCASDFVPNDQNLVTRTQVVLCGWVIWSLKWNILYETHYFSSKHNSWHVFHMLVQYKCMQWSSWVNGILESKVCINYEGSIAKLNMCIRFKLKLVNEHAYHMRFSVSFYYNVKKTCLE